MIINENTKHVENIIDLRNEESLISLYDYLSFVLSVKFDPVYELVKDLVSFFKSYNLYGPTLAKKEELSKELMQKILLKYDDLKELMDNALGFDSRKPVYTGKKYFKSSPGKISEFYEKYWESFDRLLYRFGHLLFNALAGISLPLSISANYYSNIDEDSFNNKIRSIHNTLFHIENLMETLNKCRDLEVFFNIIVEEELKRLEREH